MTCKKMAFCLDCGVLLGDYKPGFAKNHLKKFPTHDRFLIKKLVDPLLLDDPDEWFKHKRKTSIGWKQVKEILE